MNGRPFFGSIGTMAILVGIGAPLCGPTTRSGLIGALLALGLAAGCSAPTTGPAVDPLPSAEPPPAVAAPIDLAGARASTRVAFREVAGAWVARGEGLTVEAARGEVRVALSDEAAARFRTRCDGAGAARVEGDGALAVRCGASVERWRAAGGTVEQSWTFEGPPAAADLTLEVVVGGMAFRSQDATGLHFSPADGPGLRYGHATWVDADGARTAVPARWNGAAIALTVPAAVVARSRFPAVLDPTIGPEVALDPTLNNAPRLLVRSPKIACHRAGCFAVWQDLTDLSGDIWGARVSLAGEVLDRSAIRIRVASGRQETPNVATNGTNFLVVWSATTSGTTTYEAARVDLDGRVLDATPIALDPEGTSGAEAPAVASDGTSYLVAFRKGGLGVVRGVSSAGALLGAAASRVTAGGSRFALAGGAGGYLAAWESPLGVGQDIRAARVRADGTVLDPDGRTVTVAALDRRLAAVATDGTRFMVVWNALLGAGSRAPGVYGTMLDTDGATVGPSVTYFGSSRNSASTHDPIAPAVAFNGTHFVVSWADLVTAPAETLYASRVDRSGALVDATPRSLGASPGTPMTALDAADATDVPLVWSAGTLPLIQRVRPDGTPAALAGYVAFQVDVQDQAAATSDGTSFLAVWSNTLSSHGPIRAARISAAGALLDAAPVTVSTDGALEPEGVFVNGAELGASWTGDRYVATWRDRAGGYRGQQIGAGGALVGANVTFPFAPMPWYFAAPAFTGGRSALSVTWVSARPDLRRDQINLTRFAPDGRVLDAATTVLQNDLTYDSFAVTGVGVSAAGALAVWGVGREYPSIGNRQPLLRAARVNVDGDLLDPVPLELPVGGMTASPTIIVAVATDGTDFLVAWQDAVVTYPYVPRDSRGRINAARVSMSRGVLDTAPIRVSSSSTGQRGVAVGWDGRSYVVAWTDTTRGGGDVMAARVGRDGVVLDPAGVALSADPATFEGDACLASNPDGRSLVVYHHFDPRSNTERIFGRVVALSGDGGVLDAGSPDAALVDVPTDRGTPPVDAPAADVPPADVPTDRGAPPADVPPADASATDVPAADVATSDLGSPVDAGDLGRDVVADDAGEATDVGVEPRDGATTDRGSVRDVAVADAGSADAGQSVDAGQPDDAPDASAADAGTAPPDDDGGLCSVAAGPGATRRAPTSWVSSFVLGLALLSKRRRRARARRLARAAGASTAHAVATSGHC